MGHYVTLGARDHDAACAFYDVVLATVGWAAHQDFPGWRGYSEGGANDAGATLWVCRPFDGAAASSGNGTMMAFTVDDPAKVDAFHAAAMANGGSDEGAPGPRGDGGFYAAYFRDPDGNKLNAFVMG
jgi:catechol 2,3-dioxygenase-like lactoylglutathione lyase family enzyme